MPESLSPLISLIVPVYNIAKYLERCVDSIVHQSYKNLEIIMIDDGSTDDSGEICDAFSQKDKRVKVIHKTNGGLSSARNTGLDAMTGDYVGFVDGDDFIDSYMYETLIKAALDHDADIVQTGFYHTQEDGCIIDRITFKKSAYYNLDDMFHSFFESRNIHVGVWTKLYKRDIFKNIRFLEGHVFEDYTIMPGMLNACKIFVVIDGAFYKYVHNPGSISRDKMTLNVIKSRLAAPMYLLKCIQDIDRKYVGYAYHYICISSIRGYNKIQETDRIDGKTIKEYSGKLIDKYRFYFRLFRKEKSFRRQSLFKRIKLYIFSINPYLSRLFFYVLRNSVRKSKMIIKAVITPKKKA